jgi:lipopolysaccharide exporter
MLKPGAYSLLNRISIQFFGFVSVYFMYRSLAASGNGVWTLFLSVTSILELLRNGFIRNPFISHVVSADNEKKPEIIATSLVLHIFLAILTILFLVISARPLANFWNQPDLEVLFYIYAVRAIVLVPSLHFEYLQQAQLEFKGVFINNALRIGLFAVYNMVEYFMGKTPTLVELGLVQLITAIIAVIVVYPFVKKLPYPVFPLKYSKELIGKLSSFGKYTLGTVVSSMVVRSTDSWMIGKIRSASDVAMYNPALRIANLVETPTLAITNLVFPQVNKKMKERGREGVKDIYIKSVSLILAIMAPMVLPLYLLSDFLVEIIFGKAYMAAAPILRVTIFYTLIIPFNRQFGTVLDALKKPKLNFYLLVMMCVLNAILNYHLLKTMGLMGSAYATLFSYLIIFVLNQIILYRMFGINTFKVIPAIFEWYVVGWEIFQNKILKRVFK